MKKQFIMAMALSLFAVPAAADEGYLFVKGTKQGEFKSDNMQKGREGLNKVVAFEYSTGITPTNGMGIATGKRVRPNVTFVLEWSRATPLFINAAINNENLSLVRYDNYSNSRFATAGAGTQTLAEKLEFNNARVLGVKIHDNNGNDPGIAPLVTITLSYQSVTITHTEGSIVAHDDVSGQ